MDNIDHHPSPGRLSAGWRDLLPLVGFGKFKLAAAESVPLMTGWTEDGGAVRLTTLTDVVSIGGAGSALAGFRLSVIANGANAGTVETGALGSVVAHATRVTGDANNRFEMLAGGVIAWGDGAAVTDVFLTRGGANELQLGSADVLNAVAAGTLGIKNASGDAQPNAVLGTQSLSFGAGVAAVVDWVIARESANNAELASADSLWAVGAGQIGVKSIAGAPVAAASLGIAGGEALISLGGASGLDWSLSHVAANNAEMAASDNLWAVGLGQLGVRSVTGSANVAAGLSLVGGAGTLSLGDGAGAADVLLARSGANTLAITASAGVTPVASGGLLGTAALRWQGTFGGFANGVRASGVTPLAVLPTDGLIIYTAGAASVVNLPAVATVPVGWEVTIKKIAGAFTVTITPAAGTIDGAATLVLAAGVVNSAVTVVSDGANWFIKSNTTAAVIAVA